MSSWFSVCSLSSCPPPNPAPLCLPTASISSINIIHGAFFFPCSKRSRTRDAPTPTNISTKSAPLIEKNGTPDSPATARASNVFPVPGGPNKRTPRGIFPPNFWNFAGVFKNSIISDNSSFASSAPATSLNVTFIADSLNIFAFDLPNEKIPFVPPPPDCILLIIIIQTTIIKIQGSAPKRGVNQPPSSFSTEKLTPFSVHALITLSSILV